MAKYDDIISKIENLTTVELAELVKEMEEKFGISASAPAVATPQAVGASSAEEKTTFNILLKSAGDLKINVIKIVGIEDVNANQLKFYPNPVQDQISIHNPWKNNQLVQVNMYDSVGKLVLKNTSNDSLIQLSLKDLAPGIYYLQLVQGQTISKSRFVHTR